jgi:hypothetical protein
MDTSQEISKLENNKLKYVLEPCEIPSSIDKNKLKEYVCNYILPRQEFYIKTNRPLYIEDEFSEWWIEKASGGYPVGKGNGATDVITSSKEGIDVMCVIMNSNQTNEKSLIQNFNTAGCDLDSLFKNKEDTSAINLFMDDLKKKLLDVRAKYQLCELYILAYISLQNSIYVCCFKYNIDLIGNIISSGFTKQGQSIMVGNFIDERFGNVKLYKAKKRLELRLSSSCVNENPFAIKIY